MGGHIPTPKGGSDIRTPTEEQVPKRIGSLFSRGDLKIQLTPPTVREDVLQGLGERNRAHWLAVLPRHMLPNRSRYRPMGRDCRRRGFL